MRKITSRRIAAWALITMMIVTMAAPQSQAQGEKMMTEINIAGNQNISREAILSVVEEKSGTPFDAVKMQTDRTAIENLGYFSVVSAKDEEVPGGVKVTFEVIENPKISKIEFKGNTIVTAKELLDAIRMKEGQVFNVNTLDQDVRAIEDLYTKKGSIGYVTGDAEINPDTGVLTLPVLELRVGKISFQGLKKTKTYVLLREMKTKTGNIYNANVLRKDITTIYEMELLDVQEAKNPITSQGDTEGTIDITIPVKEKKTGQVSVGLGYSSQQQVVGRIEVSETNFQGKGLGVNALVEQSGTSSGGSYELGFSNPWWRKDHTSLSARIYDKRIYRFSNNAISGGSNLGDQNDYYERRKGASVGFSKPLSEQIRAFLTLRTEGVDSSFTDTQINAPYPFISQNGQVSSVNVKGALNTRDFALDPGTGNYFTVSLEPGYSTISGAEGIFEKLEVDLRKYWSAGGPKMSVKDKRRTFALRLQGSFSNGNLPFFEQYFMGGAERLRGYTEDRFWGNKALLASAEYRVPISGGLSGVGFMDYGGAWGSDYISSLEQWNADAIINNANPLNPPMQILPEQSSGFQGHLGYGLGIRVSTPIGNLRFDYAIGDDGARTHFSIGQAF
ncbi:MAG: BamA/TamA family outer membrane protein [Armatimonadota bacterium]